MNNTHIDHIYGLLGAETVLLPIPRGSKGPIIPGWQKITLAESKDATFRITFRPKPGDQKPRSIPYAGLLRNGNLGVLQGRPSAGICSIDIDDETWVAPILEANPWLKDTLQTCGHRGRNFWLRVTDAGAIPSFNLSDPTGKQVVEFRADGRQTVIYGRHPKGVDYAILHEAPPAEKSMSEIVWPEGLAVKAPTMALEHALEKFPIPETPRIERRRKHATSVLKCTSWTDNVTGFCQCPGESKHTNPSKSQDCMVMIDSTPTIFCFHNSCAEEVSDANRVLRSEIRSTEAIELPSGTVSRDEVADEIFRRLGEDRILYTKGGAVVEIEQGDQGETHLRPMRANEIVSRMERVASFIRRKRTKEGWVNEPSLLTAQTGAELLACIGANVLPKIDNIHNCAVLIERDGELVVGGKGYHPERRVLVADASLPTELAVPDAVEALNELLGEFQFLTEGDRARALAAFLTPAMLWAGLIRRAPLSALEADESQSGKTTFQMMVAAAYNETPAYIASRKGGVGSLDESISTALSRGHAIILIDNLRDMVNSQNLESLMTCNGAFPVRVPGKAEMLVNPNKVIFQMTSNGFQMTQDLANRSCTVRIRKRHGHAYKSYGVGKGIEDHVRENHSFYLGCVFAIVRDWHAKGQPGTGTTEHDFQDWASACDWIVQNTFGTVPLLQGHRSAQRKSVSRYLGWAEVVASTLRKSGDWERWLRVSDIASTCEAMDIIDAYTEPDAGGGNTNQRVGRMLGHVTGKGAVTPLDEGFIHRASSRSVRDDGRGYREVKLYAFSENAAPPDPPDITVPSREV